MKITAFIVLLFIVTGCHTKQEEIKYLPEAKFSISDSIRCRDSITFEEVFYLSNWSISQDKIITRNLEDNDFIKVYSYPDFKQLYNYGKNGKGPGEWIVQNWGVAKNNNEVILYDIMRKSLYTFNTDSTILTLTSTYELSSKDELCPPFTKIHQFNDSLFILKEDEQETYLHLMNLRTKHVYSSYKCPLKERPKHPYTPFDYILEISQNNIMLAYSYMNRIEFLKVNDSYQLFPFLVIGDDRDHSKVNSYNELPNYFLDVCSYDGDFYCLTSKENTAEGNTVYVFNNQGVPKKKIVLDREVNKIKFAPNGALFTHKTNEEGNVLYIYNL